jgi:hypothetical protein
MATYTYECMNTSCGYVEPTNRAPVASKRCPKCGGTLKRTKT